MLIYARAPLTLLLTFLLCTGGRAQHEFSAVALESMGRVELPALDNNKLFTAEMAARKPGRANKFAVTIPQQLRPENAGAWTREGSTSIWRLPISSPGAKTLNLGFSEYKLPAGAELYLKTTEESVGPFTAADNADHNQLWTPVVPGDELVVELRVPTKSRDLVQLYLTSVNHDFADITKSAGSGACNLDVICSELDGFGVIDNYRDIIRAVGAYTINGSDECTGFLVNNTKQDGTPYFMTANHCKVREGNAASVVVFWNFESPFCRPIGSAASGGRDRGSRRVFNSGATFLARAQSSDMCLLLLDDPVNPAANAFFAGWSREEAAPTDTLIVIHHPDVGDKRITFKFGDATRVGSSPSNVDPNGRYIRVNGWDVGTTEKGSSGSPIFDRNNRVRGQLWQGDAGCDNPGGFDQFGFFTSSWEGDGTPASSLRPWLDPVGLNPLTLDGLEQNSLAIRIAPDRFLLDLCTSDDGLFTLAVPAALGVNFRSRIASDPDGLAPELSQSVSDEGGVITVRIPADNGRARGLYEFEVEAAGSGGSSVVTLSVNVVGAVPPKLFVTNPANNARNVSPLTDFIWQPQDGVSSYDLQVSVAPDFSSLTVSERIAERTVSPLRNTTYALNTALTGDRTYYWRVRGNNACGPGPWATASFEVTDQRCARVAYDGLDVPIADNTVTARITVSDDVIIDDIALAMRIDHSYVGDLSGTLAGPNGLTINLFNGPLSGSCSGDNIDVVFSDAAPNSSRDFEQTCTDDVISVSGLFQPINSLSAFNGRSARGVWTLTIVDDAIGDSGDLVDFGLDICSRVGFVNDFSVTAAEPEWEACLGRENTFRLLLGSAYNANATVSVTDGSRELTGFTTSINEADNTATLVFADWGGLEIGTRQLTIEVMTGDETSRVITLPLTLLQAAEPASLRNPAPNATIASDGRATLTWLSGAGVEGFSVETSLTEDFDEVLTRVETGFTEVELVDLPLGQPIYWRVISNNESCGSAVSEVRSFTSASTATFDFDDDRSVSLYPNPVRGQLTVDVLGNWPERIEGTLHDATGRTLRAYRIERAGRTQWDVRGLPGGLYFLRLRSGRRVFTERLVVAE